jgi:CRP-like cAMP-binding protein
MSPRRSSQEGSSGGPDNPGRAPETQAPIAPSTPVVPATAQEVLAAGTDAPDAQVLPENPGRAMEPAEAGIGRDASLGGGSIGEAAWSSSSGAAARKVGPSDVVSSSAANSRPNRRNRTDAGAAVDSRGQHARDGVVIRPAIPSSSESTFADQQQFGYSPVRISKEIWQSQDDLSAPKNVDTKVPVENSLGFQNDNMPPGIFTPYGRFRRKWDFFIIFLVVYTATVSVFVHSFILVIRINEPWFWIENFIDLSFFIDILLWFRTAYITEDMRLETSRKKIAFHYLRTWFAVDAISTFPWDTLAYLIQKDSEPGWLQIPRLLRLFRFLKILSVLRVLRIKRNITRLEIRLRIKYGYLRMVWLLCIVVLIVHWGACLFYLFGELSGPKAASWIGQDGVPSTHFGLYVTALYFSTYTITTTGYGDVTPENTLERAFNICLMLVGAITYAFIISQVGETVVDLSAANTKYRREMDELTDFSSTNSLPFDLTFDLRRYFQHRTNYQHPGDHQILLNSMSADLRTKVMSHLYKQSLKASYLLQNIGEKKRDAIYVRMASGLASPGEVLYMEGDQSDCMYTILHGNVRISDSADNFQYLGPGSVFGEDELLFNSHRRATATAIDYCDFAKVSREAVIAILRRDAKVLRYLLLQETSKFWVKTISRAEKDVRFWTIACTLRAAARKRSRFSERTIKVEGDRLIRTGTDSRNAGDGIISMNGTFASGRHPLMTDKVSVGASTQMLEASGLSYAMEPDDGENLFNQPKFLDVSSSDDDSADSSGALRIEDSSYIAAADMQFANSLTRAELEREFLSRGRRVARYKARVRTRFRFSGY